MLKSCQTFNKVQASCSFDHHVGEHSDALQYGGYTNPPNLLKNQTATKYLPQMIFLSHLVSKKI